MPDTAPTLVETRTKHGRPHSELARGATVGRYVIERVLGSGGMGIVYLARDPKLDRPIALKLLLAGFDSAALVREARALAKLQDPHVVAVYDAGELDDGRVFIAMQYVDGDDLEHALKRRRPPVTQILAWFVAAGRGLAAAHAEGLVHRDFKPGNVLVDRRGRIAVTDFGLAHEVGGRPTTLGGMIGTPAYMAPEQLRGGGATQSSDQFAFCVSLWESLYGQHPFLHGDAGSTSPYAIAMAITEGELIQPPSLPRLPRAVVDALTRGLAREPHERWPALSDLLEVLAPPARARRWPIVVGGAIAVCALASAGVLVALERGGARTSCEDESAERAASVWSPDVARLAGERFAATGRSYASNASRELEAGVNRYLVRWRQLAGDVCRAERAGKVPEVTASRRACVDARLDGLRGLVELVTARPRSELVDHTDELVALLPDLGDCVTTDAPGPPAPIAGQVRAVERELELARARSLAGDFRGARSDFDRIVERADRLGYAPLEVSVHGSLADMLVAATQPARAEAERALALALEHGLDRDAVRAYGSVMLAASLERQHDLVITIGRLARAAAAHTKDRRLELATDVFYGRALARLHQLDEAAVTCRTALATARTIDDDVLLRDARDCLIEALAPASAYSELEPLLAQALDDSVHVFGADHPRIADYLDLRATVELRRGKVTDARRDVDRALEIRQRTYGSRGYKVAEGLVTAGDVSTAEGKPADARKLYEQALATTAGVEPEPLVLISTIQQSLAYALQDAGDHKGAVVHLEEALALVRRRGGNDSLELAMLLLNFGQLKADDDYAAGLAMLGEARTILDAKHDKRANLLAGVIARIELTHGKWTDARRHAEEALAHVDADADPRHVALIQFVLAQALVETHGDRTHARTLATTARAAYVKLGPEGAATAKTIDQWLAIH